MRTLPDFYQLARRFVLQRARPIDHAKWRFHFEGAPAETVLDILSQYQNPDGGFGHGLEADFWNPASSPMQTWAATEVIHSVNHHDAEHPMVLGILRYLESGADFDGRAWGRTVATNNDHPRADWWSHQTPDPFGGELNYNPTASLAGFALQFAKAGSPLHGLAKRIADEALRTLLTAESVEVHELSCFYRLFQSVSAAKTDVGVDLTQVEQAIVRHVNASITRDTARWSTDYVCRPSRFIRGRGDWLLTGNEDLAAYECRFLRQTQLPDGSWPVTWSWSAFPNEWPVAKEWWKTAIIVENLLFLKNMDALSEVSP